MQKIKHAAFAINRRAALLASALACLAAAGCGDSAAPAGAAQAWRNGGVTDGQKALDALSTQAHGFSLGSAAAPRVAYVMFDPKCPHCAALWVASKPVAQVGQVRFVWVPVAAISKESFAIGAGILDQQSPQEAMDANEASISAKQGGLKFEKAPSDQSAEAIKSNSKIAASLGLEEVPIIVIKGMSGQPVVSAGSMSTDRLREFLRL